MICHLWAFTDSDTATPACLSITAMMLKQFPSTSVIATPKSPLISTFTSSKSTKPRWLNLLSMICSNQKGRFNYMLSRLFWCKNGATLCAMIFTISHDTTRKRTKRLRYRTLFTIFNAIYAMSITARDKKKTPTVCLFIWHPSLWWVPSLFIFVGVFFLSHWTEVGKGQAFAIRTKNNT